MSGRGSVKEISTKPRNTRKNMGRQARASGLNPSANSEVMTIREVADYLNCHLNTAYRLVNDRKIPSFKLGNDWRFLKSEIEKWIAKGGGKVKP